MSCVELSVRMPQASWLNCSAQRLNYKSTSPKVMMKDEMNLWRLCDETERGNVANCVSARDAVRIGDDPATSHLFLFYHSTSTGSTTYHLYSSTVYSTPSSLSSLTLVTRIRRQDTIIQNFLSLKIGALRIVVGTTGNNISMTNDHSPSFGFR